MEDSLKLILKICCDYFNVPEEKIKSKNRHKKYSIPRHIYNYLSRKYTSNTLRQIGEYINRDHTSVCHSIDSISDCFYTKQEPYDDVQKLQIILNTELDKNITKVVFTFDKEVNWNKFITKIMKDYEPFKSEIFKSKINDSAI